MFTFVFDIDDTLILHNKENNNYYETPNNGELKRLIEKTNCQQIYIYTNGTYSHGEGIVDNLLLDTIIPKKNIFGRDTIPHMKPYIKSFNHVNEIIKKDTKYFKHDIYFFDDLIDNLITARSIGWVSVWISPDFINKPDYIDYAFPNIFQALLSFIELK